MGHHLLRNVLDNHRISLWKTRFDRNMQENKLNYMHIYLCTLLGFYYTDVNDTSLQAY